MRTYGNELYLKRMRRKNQTSQQEEQAEICLFEIDDYSREDIETSTIDISDMPEGEPVDASVVFADKQISLSPSYCGVCNILDRVLVKHEIQASVICRFMLILDSTNNVSVMSRNLCECLLQHLEFKSKTVLTENKVLQYFPAKRMIVTDVKVADVTLRESFVVIEDIALITAALGRIATENLTN